MGQWYQRRVHGDSSSLAVLVTTSPAGRATIDIMVKLHLFLLLVADVSLGARRLRGNGRGAKSLVNTFPFNADEAEIHQGHHDGHHQEHHEHNAAPSNSVQGLFDARDSRQGSDDTDVSFPAVAAAGPGADGKRCIDKVEMVEETEYDETVQCDHSYDRRRTAKRTLGRAASSSTSRLLSTRPPPSAGPPMLRIVTSRDLRFAGLSTNPSAGQSRRSTMWRTTWSSAPLRLRRSVRMRPLDTPPKPSAPSGPRRFAACPRSQ